MEPHHGRSKPLGIRFMERVKKTTLSFRAYQAIVLILTFFAYASYHTARKTMSEVKSALDPQPSELRINIFSWKLRNGWAPFNESDGTELLGALDVAFLAVYAVGMFFSGHLGDRMNLRIFLTVGMIGTGFFTCLFGAGYWFSEHTFYYFLVVQMLSGLLQSTGWPSVVAVVGNWCGKSKRGLVMGIWNAHTSVGNITGSLIGSVLLGYGWGWSFLVPGLVIAVVGLVVFLFLPVSPESVGVRNKEDDDDDNDELHSPKKKNGVKELLE